jgi:GT2 family glycosyltransferase
VIVVDDGAAPPLASRLAPYSARLSLRTLRLDRQSLARQGAAAARNAGAKLALAPLLVFLDDDCLPHPHWLAAYLAAHAAHPASALAGPILNALPNNLCSEAYHLIFGFLYARHIERGRTSAPFLISANFAVPAAAFLALAGFDERFTLAGEDRMFSAAWRRSGRPLRPVPNASVRHLRPFTIRTFLAQQYRYGRGSRMVRKAAAPLPFESSSFYLDLLLTAFRHPAPAQRIPLFLLLIASQAAIAAGQAAELFRPALPPRHLD